MPWEAVTKLNVGLTRRRARGRVVPRSLVVGGRDEHDAPRLLGLVVEDACANRVQPLEPGLRQLGILRSDELDIQCVHRRQLRPG
jgi:hypothetical protein